MNERFGAGLINLEYGSHVCHLCTVPLLTKTTSTWCSASQANFPPCYGQLVSLKLSATRND